MNLFSAYDVIICVINGNSWLYTTNGEDSWGSHINIVSGNKYGFETEEEWMKKDIFFFGGDYDEDGMNAYNRK